MVEGPACDFDWLIIGSGFGGSVSALRLTEKGYRVGVLEAGLRFADSDFAQRASQAARYYFLPALGMQGIFKPTLFKDLFLVTGAGMGGGSLGYANTLYRARPEFATHPQWSRLGDWDAELAPHFDTAERMLGVVDYDRDTAADELLREYATEHGFGHTYRKTPVGVFLGEPGKTVPEPYFGGSGPARTGRVRCGSCLLGCRYGAKNTLVKNYLWFAEKQGAQILPGRTVVDVRPLGAADGGDGYAVTSERTGAWVRRDRRTVTARGVVVAAGALGTNRLLLRCKLSGALPRLSDRLGTLVRTNSEAILGVLAPDDTHDFSAAVALTSGIYPGPDIHIQPVTYGGHADIQSLLYTLANPRGTRRTRPLYFLRTAFRHPRRFVRSLRIRGTSRRTIMLTTMKTVESAMRLRVRFRLPTGFPVLTTEQDRAHPNPDFLPEAYRAADWIADRLGGTTMAAVPEAVFAIPTTAHLLGGAVIGETPETGVIDSRHRVFGYRNLLVCDGAAVPANVGNNPSLTITAMAERAMTFVEARNAAP
ncbi:FAD-dependent oxidoreductase [Nocardia crassostreae]|uniref:FAD-dependent oxidoreductase n=1 Tax=Nocardia crassostreae TaxID=53428 RepID=UPI000835EEF5|nr:GMC family oxidoreductase [Nocardia crassostreae]